MIVLALVEKIYSRNESQDETQDREYQLKLWFDDDHCWQGLLGIKSRLQPIAIVNLYFKIVILC